MTLIISAVGRGAICHTSDRQVTVSQQGRPTRIHSDVENKTVIIACKDGIAVLGYTGSAYLDNVPTDHWLVSKISPQPNLGEFGFGGRGYGKLPLQAAIWRVISGLRNVNLPSAAATLKIDVSGFRRHRKRWTPFLLSIRCQKKLPRFPNQVTFDDNLHSTPPPKGIFLNQIGDVFPTSTFHEFVRERIKKSQKPAHEKFMDALTQATRHRAKQTPTVGSDIMEVFIPSPHWSRTVTWNFNSLRSHQARFSNGKDNFDFPIVYSPWIVSPFGVTTPSFGSGGFIVGAGHWEIKCISKPVVPAGTGLGGRHGGRLLFTMSHQQRRSP